MSEKETPTKETTKKVATPSARLECQLPEKRQKLDLPPEPEPKETTDTAIPTSTPPTQPLPSATANNNETSAPAAAATTVEVSQDVEMEKSNEEQITDILVLQPEPQKSDAAPTENSDEKKTETINTVEQEKIIAETKQKPLEEGTKNESNGETKIACEKMEESCNSVTDAATIAENACETPAETAIKNDAGIEKANATKMEIDNEDNVNANDDDMKIDNTNAATEKTEIETDSEKTNNVDTSSSSNCNTTISNNNTSTNTATNKITTTITTTTTTINNTSNSDSKKDTALKDGGGNEGNGVVTGKIPVDIPKSSADNDADTAVVDVADAAIAATVTTNTQAESAIDGEAVLETAVVLNTDTTTTSIIIDEVALLKAATADPAIITDKGDGENITLTEAIDGITTTDTAAADSVECSLFAKKTHLGNGNNATTTLVGTEEMAN